MGYIQLRTNFSSRSVQVSVVQRHLAAARPDSRNQFLLLNRVMGRPEDELVCDQSLGLETRVAC